MQHFFALSFGCKAKVLATKVLAVKVYFKCTMHSLPLCHAFPFSLFVSLSRLCSICFIITFILTLHQTLALFLFVFFSLCCSCLLCALMSMLCLKGLAAVPRLRPRPRPHPPPATPPIVRQLCSLAATLAGSAFCLRIFNFKCNANA